MTPPWEKRILLLSTKYLSEFINAEPISHEQWFKNQTWAPTWQGLHRVELGSRLSPIFLNIFPFFPLNLYWGEPKCLQPFAMKIDGDTEISNKLFTQRGSEALIEKFFWEVAEDETRRFFFFSRKRRRFKDIQVRDVFKTWKREGLQKINIYSSHSAP